jgi:hypothetical protein
MFFDRNGFPHNIDGNETQHQMFWSTPTGYFPKGIFKFNW